MWNNTTHQEVQPPNLQAAITYLRAAMAAGQKVDVGLAQVDTENFAAYGLTPQTAFDPCTNLRAGGAILQASWRQALGHGMSGQMALYHSFEAYNSGRLWGDSVYANRVLRAAGVPVNLQGGFERIVQWKPPFFAQSWDPAGNWNP
jgi:type IV secretion system protein VirB1